MRFSLFAYALAFCTLPALSCRSTDKQTQICEQNNRECQQNCVNSNANFTNTRLPTQPVGPCDLRCEQSYQSCLKRSENPGVRIIDAER